MLLRHSAAGLAEIAGSGSVAEAMLEQMLIKHGHRASPGEVKSWRRSLPLLAQDLVQAGLGDVEVLVEYRLPLTSRRADAIIAGQHPRTGAPSYVVVELKQWSGAGLYEDEPGAGDRDRLAWVTEPRLHPLEQVRGVLRVPCRLPAGAGRRCCHAICGRGVPAQRHRIRCGSRYGCSTAATRPDVHR